MKTLVNSAEWPKAEQAGGATLDLSPDERRVAAHFWPRSDSSLTYNTLRIYDVGHDPPKVTAEHQLAWTPNGDTTGPRFAPDSRRLTVPGKVTTIVDAANHETIEIPMRSADAVLFADGIRVALCDSHKVVIWDLAKGAVVHTHAIKTSGGGGGALHSCALSPDDEWVITGDTDNNTRVFSTTAAKTKKLNKTRASSGPRVRFDAQGGIVFGPDKSDAGVVVSFRTVAAPTTPVLELPIVYPLHTVLVDLHLAADGAHLLATRWNGDRSTVDVYAIATKQRIATADLVPTEGRDKFRSARLFADGRVLASTMTGRILMLS